METRNTYGPIKRSWAGNRGGKKSSIDYGSNYMVWSNPLDNGIDNPPSNN